MIGISLRALTVFLRGFVKPAFLLVAVGRGDSALSAQIAPVAPAVGIVRIGFGGLAAVLLCFIKLVFALIAIGRGFAPVLT